MSACSCRLRERSNHSGCRVSEALHHGLERVAAGLGVMHQLVALHLLVGRHLAPAELGDGALPSGDEVVLELVEGGAVAQAFLAQRLEEAACSRSSSCSSTEKRCRAWV